MRRVFGVALVLSSFLLHRGAPARIGEPSVVDISDAITELDVSRAQKLLSGVSQDSAGLALERARLSLYVGDCDAASATLARRLQQEGSRGKETTRWTYAMP